MAVGVAMVWSTISVQTKISLTLMARMNPIAESLASGVLMRVGASE